MQNLATFDLIIILITLLLGLKGLFRGFIKEIFGILGIIGAIFIASRVAFETGKHIAPLLGIENIASIKFIGFVFALVVVWLVIYSFGVLISKMFSVSGLGIIDRFFGFIFGMLKVFLIFSVITYALYQINSFKKMFDDKFANSVLVPYLIDIGSYIIKIDTSSIVNNIDKTIQNVTNDEDLSISESTEELKNNLDSTVEKIQKGIEEGIQENIQSEIDKAREKLKDVVNE